MYYIVQIKPFQQIVQIDLTQAEEPGEKKTIGTKLLRTDTRKMKQQNQKASLQKKRKPKESSKNTMKGKKKVEREGGRGK